MIASRSAFPQQLPAAPVDATVSVRLAAGTDNALFGGRHIALTALEAERIRALCVTDRCRTHVEQLTRHRPTP